MNAASQSHQTVRDSFYDAHLDVASYGGCSVRAAPRCDLNSASAGEHQDMAFTLTPERKAAAEQLIKRYPVPRAACIPILHLCQQQVGWVSPEAIAYVADRLRLTNPQGAGGGP